MRQFIATSLPDKNGRIALTEKEKRYLINVLRIKKGDEIEVRLPNGVLCAMSVRNSEKKTGIVELVLHGSSDEAIESVETISSNDLDYWLFQFLPKGQKMDLIVRQATECGVRLIVPIIGDYSIVGKARDSLKENTAKVERWMRIVREAQQQSGSPIDTKIVSPCEISAAMRMWTENKKERLAFVLREKLEEQDNLSSIIHKKGAFENTSIGFAVGCEGGVSPKELSVLHENGFFPMHFNTNILRAETAALYGLAALQTVIEEYTTWKELRG